jgi:hypothetical protein
MSIRRAAIGRGAVLVLACLALAGLAAPGAPAHHLKKKDPAPRTLYWGAWIGDQLTGTQPPWDMSAVTAFEQLAGKPLSLIQFAQPFADCSGSPCRLLGFPAPEADKIRAYGAIPILSWASQSIPAPLDLNQPDFQLSDVLAGRYDAFIRRFAEEARDWGHPFFLRFNWEMNGDWFAWHEGVNGNQPGEGIAVWRHVHDIFSSVGAANATWVWCPYADAPGRYPPVGRFYPGDAYVDWTCLDGYNWAKNSVNPHPWRSFDAIFRSTYRAIVRRVARSKPMMLAEMASGGRSRAKAKWVLNMFRQLPTRYRRIRALVWFEQVDRGVQWPIANSPLVVRAFAHGVRHRAFKGNFYAGLAEEPIRPPR